MKDGHELSLDELAEEIATLAAHIHAATCRWLGLVAEFDARGTWSAWGARSCADWISWRCSMSPVSAREHVRVARRLVELPLVRGAFARGELSYSKVRALTRVQDIEREEELVDLARTATAAQLERIVRGYRRVVAAEDAERAYEARYLQLSYDDDGSLLVRGRLAPEEGAVLRRALEAARDELIAEQRRGAAGEEGASAEASDRTIDDADALGLLAESVLAHGVGQRSGGDRYQVIVHIEADSLKQTGEGARCELDDGTPLARETAQRVCCDASLVALVERDGHPLSVGRQTRSIPPALRRALRSRDGGCCFPACTHRRRLDAHHIQHWSQGGETSLENLVQLCRHHHRLVHEGGFHVERHGRGVLFRRPDGKAIPAIPRSRCGDPGHLADDSRRRDLRIGSRTCQPLWAGDPLDLPAAVDAMLYYAPLRPRSEGEQSRS